MKKNDLLLIISVSLYSYLFYNQSAGINFLLFNLCLIALLVAKNGIYRNLLNISWWGAVAGSLISAFCILLYGNTLSVITNILSLSLVAAFSVEKNSSFLLAGFYSLCSYVSAIVFMFIDWVEIQNKKASAEEKKGFKLFLLVIPVLVAILFFFLYRESNPLFKNFTANINLDFITWSWIEFTFLGFVLLYGFFYHRYIPQLMKKDLSASNNLTSIHYSDNNNRLLGFKIDLHHELSTGIILFSLLNILLLFVNVLDFQYVWLDSKLPEGLNYSEAVHQGIGTLITSILLAVLIILIFFRGNINFSSSGRTIKIVAYLWILQNAFMILSTVIRNQLYIHEYSLTYKRIGVYVYLLLCLIGLCMTLLKIAKAKSNWYLFRSNSWLFYVVLVISCFFNWDRIITSYNLNNSQVLDRDYLITLSSANTDQLLTSPQMQLDNEEVGITTLNSLHTKMYLFLEHYEKKEWKSWNLKDELIHDNLVYQATYRPNENLFLSGAKINSLKPVSVFQNIRNLDLSNTSFTSLPELTYFRSLEKLTLNHNNLDSIHKMPVLTKLSNLNLSGNSIREFYGLQNLKALQILDLSYNKNETINSLPILENLRELNLSGNKVGALTILNRFKKLRTLRMNAIDKSELETLPSSSTIEELELRNLNLSGSDEKAICAITEMKGLKKLILSTNNLQNLYMIPHELFSVRKSTEGLATVLTKIPASIETLDISYNKIAFLDGIECLPMLRSLDISANELSDISGIEKSVGLKYLSLGRNKIFNTAPLSNLSLLQSLDLDNNLIHDIKPLTSLEELQSLNLSTNKISDLSPLSKLKKLSYLNVSYNAFSNVSSLAELSNLEVLDISNCPVNDLTPLYKLKKLKKLYAYGIDREKLKKLQQQLPKVEIIEYVLTEATDYR